MNSDTRNKVTKCNPFSCALASIVFEAQRSGNSQDQQEILRAHAEHFPAWKDQPGILRPWEILKLLSLMKLEPDQFIATRSVEEARSFMRSPSWSVFASFYWIRLFPDAYGNLIPTNHCMALMAIADEFIEVMDPDPSSVFPRRFAMHAHPKMDGTFLLCASPQK